VMVAIEQITEGSFVAGAQSGDKQYVIGEIWHATFSPREPAEQTTMSNDHPAPLSNPTSGGRLVKEVCLNGGRPSFP